MNLLLQNSISNLGYFNKGQNSLWKTNQRIIFFMLET